MLLCDQRVGNPQVIPKRWLSFHAYLINISWFSAMFVRYKVDLMRNAPQENLIP